MEIRMSAGRVLVTGAYGFVGAAYCDHLAATGVEFVGAVRARHPRESRPQIVELGDFQQADWDALFATGPIASVVHLAARAHRMGDGADGSAEIHAEYRRENVKVTDRLLAAARLANVRRFVFASTVKVHGESTAPGTVLTETDAVAPADEYARSKAAAERRVREFGQELGLATAILRLPLVYGPHVKANFGRLVDAVARRRVLPLGAIRNRRSLLGITNLCSALDCVRTHPGAAGATFLVSDGEDVSTPELVHAIAEALEVRPRLWRVPPPLLTAAATLAGRRRAARRLVESLAIDDARIRRTLGWRPPMTMAGELERLAASLRNGVGVGIPGPAR
jgi:nucleoside-diphosphate-sugar epimerase